MKGFTRFLPAAILCISACAPVFAADTTKTDDLVTTVSLIPARIIGWAAGAAVGVPVATLRATAERTADMQKGISQSLGDQGSPANEVYSAVAALPAGLISGVIEGPYYGLRNAGKGFEHPFSADSFSLQCTDLTRN